MSISVDDLTELLGGNRRLFTEVYEAVAEQYMLLSLKTRELYSNPTYEAWFIEQHNVLSALRTQNDAIAKVYSLNKNSSLEPALHVMKKFYCGFDDNNYIYQTLATMTNQDTSRRNRNKKATIERQEYVKNTLGKLIMQYQKMQMPIPLDARMGYSHQDLAMSFSNSRTIIKKLTSFFEIDYFDILNRTIQIYVDRNHQLSNEFKSLLSQMCHINDNTVETASIRFSFIKKLRCSLKEIEPSLRHDFLFLFNGLAAKTTYEWLLDTYSLFKARQEIYYEWECKTIDTGINESRLSMHEKYLCQISIGRESLTQMIRKNGREGFDDVALEISHALGDFYQDLLSKDQDDQLVEYSKEIVTSQQIEYRASDCIKETEHLSRLTTWYINNNVLFINPDFKRHDRVNVASWLAGLISYDLKNEIPIKNGKKLNLVPDIYDELMKINCLYEKEISISSFKRNYLKVKNAVSEVSSIIRKQIENESGNHSIGLIFCLGPLWKQ